MRVEATTIRHREPPLGGAAIQGGEDRACGWIALSQSASRNDEVGWPSAGYFRAGAAISGSGSAVVDFTRSMLMRLLTFFGPTAAISRL